MTSLLNSIKDFQNVGCSPTFEGLVISFRNKTQHETTTPNKRQAASANTGPQVKTFLAQNVADEDRDAYDSGLGALEVPREAQRDAPSPSPAAALKSSSEMLRSILSPPSAASILSPSTLSTYEEFKKATASTYEELKAEVMSSTASRTASPSSIFSPSYNNSRGSRPKGAASAFFPTATSSPSPPPATAARTNAKVEKEKSEGQSLLSRSQARRMKLQQCYSEIMKNASPTSIKEQHEQYQQLVKQQEQQEGRDDERSSSSRRSDLHATTKSPRVKAMYEFDIRDDDDEQDGSNNDEDHQEVEEYTPTHQPSNEVEPTHNNPPDEEVDEWEAAEVRRGHRTCALDLTEIEQFTQDVRDRIQQCSPRVDGENETKNDGENKKNKTPKNFQELVKEFEEEWGRREPKKTSNLSHSDVKKQKKKKEMTTASSGINEDNSVAAATVATRWKALQTTPKALSEREVPDDKLEAWWKERQQSAKKSLSASEKFDIWWKSQNENKNKELVRGAGVGSTATVFQELEGEPTVEVNNVASNVRLAAPSKKPNDVASGTLKVVLSRVDEAKEQFVKALEDNDVKRQSELAALLAQLGEAAAAMRKLGQM